jgi:hypothetical protein
MLVMQQRQAELVAACVALRQAVAMGAHHGRLFSPIDLAHPLDWAWVRAAILVPAN